MVQSEAALKPEPIATIRLVDARSASASRHDPVERRSDSQGDREQSECGRGAESSVVYRLVHPRRRQRVPITLSALYVNQGTLLHLPAESFLEYQLRAQAAAPERFVACAAYGDGGPWYIPTAEAYPQGGYEVSVAWCPPEMDGLLTGGVETLLKGGQGLTPAANLWAGFGLRPACET